MLTTTGTLQNPFGYTGEYTDGESGLVYLRARYYDPGTQQFLTVDPMLASTEHAYAYVAGSPTNFTDSSGLCVPFCAIALVAGGQAVLAWIGGIAAAGVVVGGTYIAAEAYVGLTSSRSSWDPCLFDPPLPSPGGGGNLTDFTIGASGTMAATTLTTQSYAEWCAVTTWSAQHEQYSPDTKVSDILKKKRASIKRAQLDAGSPSWDEVEGLTWGDIAKKAKANEKGYRTIKKLLGKERI